MERNAQIPKTEEIKICQSADHVGGINETSGGVDPDVDESLIRLSGGP